MKKVKKNHNIRDIGSFPSENNINIIAESTEINGNLNTSDNLRLEGKVVGKVTVKGKIVIGRKANQEGDLHCDVAEVSGLVKGNIFATKIFLKSSADLRGNISTNQLIIEGGAKFSGKCKMNDSNSSPLAESIPIEKAMSN